MQTVWGVGYKIEYLIQKGSDETKNTELAKINGQGSGFRPAFCMHGIGIVLMIQPH